MRKVGMSALALCLAVACSSPVNPGLDAAPDAPVPDAFIGPAQALFEVPRAEPPPSGFYALPFPNDIRASADGSIDLADHQRPNDLIDIYVSTIEAELRGFGLNSAAFFRFDAPVDSSTLPESAEASVMESASVYLVDVTAQSPTFGERVPLKYRFEPTEGEAIQENWLSVLPFPGRPLREVTTYAVVVTDRLRATDGTDIARGPDFETIIAGTPSEPELVRAQQIYQPLFDWLDAPGGDERADVVSAAVFTTQDATGLLRQIREVIYRDLPDPKPNDVEYIRRRDGYALYRGVYDAPVFQRGELPYMLPEDGGDIAIDAQSGEPVIQEVVESRFSVTVPDAPLPPEGWPVVLYAHGTGGDYESYIGNGSAMFFAARGLAVLSIDQVLHGPRNEGSNPEISFFNFQNPLAARDNALQGALDDFQLARLASVFQFTERRPGGRTIRFDPNRVFFFGHSQGGLTGVPFVASEPLVKGAVFSGAGALLYLSLLSKTEPVDIAGIARAFIRDDPLDEFNPILALLQAYIDRSDSANYARLLVDEPPPGNSPKNVFHSIGLIDRFTPVPSIEALATAGGFDIVAPVIEPVEGLELIGVDTLSVPVTGNRGPVTAVTVQYEEGNRDGHFVLFETIAGRTQSVEFLVTLAESGIATVVAPPPQP